MSIERTDTIDGASVVEGWVVLAIYQLEPWSLLVEPNEQLRAKLRAYERFVESIDFRHSYYMAPVRVEVHASERAPREVRTLCDSRGVVLIDGTLD